MDRYMYQYSPLAHGLIYVLVLSSSSMITDNNLLAGTEEDASSDPESDTIGRAARGFNGSTSASLLLSIISTIDIFGL